MNIHFFEEFPSRENLQKAKLIKFPSIIYLAAREFQEFLSYRQRLKDLNPRLEAAYWPIMKKSYWISPFSYTSELLSLKKDLTRYIHKRKLKVLLDLELPLINKRLFIKNLPYFFRNKKIIASILRMQERLNFQAQVALYPAPTAFHELLMRILGISYSTKKYRHKNIIMYYTSMIKEKKLKRKIKKRIIRKVSSPDPSYFKPQTEVGLGTIAKGILSTEPKLSTNNLRRDLEFLKKHKVETAVIFRLGGLNREYLEVIKRYV